MKDTIVRYWHKADIVWLSSDGQGRAERQTTNGIPESSIA
jgi:hypothetical protein